MPKPNVILITIDTLRTDMLGCYGNKIRLTPNMDKLASESIRFTQAITGGTWTQAAFPVLLTSSYASMYGGCLGPLAHERPSPIEMMASHGYTTFGLSTNPHLSKETGYGRGFHDFDNLIPDDRDPFLRRIKGGQRLLRKPLTHQVLNTFGIRMRPARIYSSAAEVTDRLRNYVNATDSPFFAWVHYMDPHWPYHIEETLTHPHDISEAWIDISHLHKWRSDKWDPAYAHRGSRFLHLYRQSLHYLDIHIGRLLSYLEKSGISSKTIIVLVSDHGDEFFEHGRWGHWEVNLFDEIIKVPLLIRIPSLDNGAVIQKQVSTLDIMPTILDLCDIPLPSGVEGSSLQSLWTDNGKSYDSTISISEMPRPPRHRIALRTEKYKFIWDNEHPDKPELYNLASDPLEKNNINDTQSEISHQFQEHIQTHLDRVVGTQLSDPIPELELEDKVIQRLRDLGYYE